ncbi:MAG TPA: L-threonylcarbamoyladenylate synthase [Candidatus Paceibacterota bacterium]|nr:L-threonylcarbamoyladenylate synthase [Candidatus Paceibacterota bacterium]
MEIFRLTEETLDEAAQKAASVLSGGGVVLYPTDTLYGLAVDALNKEAIQRLKTLKARETKKPIAVVVPHHDALEEYAQLNDTARALARRHLPGALTIVLPGSGKLPEDILLNGTLGIRIPNDPFSLALAHLIGTPYTATSANMSGLPTPPTVGDILVQFGPNIRHIDLVVDAGPRGDSKASTVVSIVGDQVYILREGAIPREELGL